MRIPLIVALAMLVAGCGTPSGAPNPPPSPSASGTSPSPVSPPPSAPDTAVNPAERWVLQRHGGGTALVLLKTDSSATIRLICSTGKDRLLVNVPGFRPIASEERLSFGSSGNAMALVADTRGDIERGGVTGVGEVPGNLALLVGARLSASYGSQKSGAHPAPPQHLARDFLAACGREPSAQAGGGQGAESVGACQMQGSERLAVEPRRAVGTEPFWGARIEGRCVTYSHPEDQPGTRVWTRYTKGRDGESWSGMLAGRQFELRIQGKPGCSDGMSDKKYPLAAELRVGGELRNGCAEPR